jgi:hypothetical protein
MEFSFGVGNLHPSIQLARPQTWTINRHLTSPPSWDNALSQFRVFRRIDTALSAGGRVEASFQGADLFDRLDVAAELRGFKLDT